MCRWILASLLIGIVSWPACGQERKQPPGPTLVLQRGHTGFVLSLAFSKDGKLLVTAGQEGQAVLWETATGRELRRFKGHVDDINAAVFSEDGQWLATCSGGGLLEIDRANDTARLVDANACLWNVATGEQVRLFKGHDRQVTCLALSHDGKLLVTGSSDNTARLWNTKTGKQVREIRHDSEAGGVTCVVFSRDGKRLFTTDDRVHMWDPTTGKQARALPPHGDAIIIKVPVNVAEKVDGKLVVRKVVKEIKQRVGVSHLVLSADGKLVVTIGTDERVVWWDLDSGKQARAFQFNNTSNAIVSADGKWLFTTSDRDTSVHVWDLVKGKETRVFNRKEPQAIGHCGLCVSQGGKWLAATESSDELDRCARMWDLATGKETRVFRGQVESVNSVSISDDGNRLVTASGTRYARGTKTAQLWDLAAGKQIRTFRGHKACVRSVAISGDGKRLVSGGNDNKARLWDVDSGKEKRVFERDDGQVTGVALSPDIKTLIAGSGDIGSYNLDDPDSGFGARSFDLKTGKRIRFFSHQNNGGVLAVAVSRDGKWLATGCCDNTPRLWNMDTGKLVRVFKGHQGAVEAVTFSRNGKWLISGSHDMTARLWDSSGGKQVRVFRGHTDIVTSTALSRDGKYLATGGDDRTARLWDLATGREIRIFQGHAAGVNCVAFVGDGKRLVTGSTDGTTRLWDVASGRELCRLVTLNGGAWIVFDQAGRFDAENPRVTGLHWVSGMRAASLRCHDPGLLAKYLGCNPKPFRMVRDPFTAAR